MLPGSSHKTPILVSLCPMEAIASRATRFPRAIWSGSRDAWKSCVAFVPALSGSENPSAAVCNWNFPYVQMHLARLKRSGRSGIAEMQRPGS